MNRVLKVVALLSLCVVFLSSFLHLLDDVWWDRKSWDERIEVIPSFVVKMEDAGLITIHREAIKEIMDDDLLSPYDGTKYVIDQVAVPIVKKGDQLAARSVNSAKLSMLAAGIAMLCVYFMSSKTSKKQVPVLDTEE